LRYIEHCYNQLNERLVRKMFYHNSKIINISVSLAVIRLLDHLKIIISYLQYMYLCASYIVTSCTKSWMRIDGWRGGLK